MRIAYVSAGAAGMWCGSCLHDNTLAAAIKSMGHDIVLIPTYTPLRTDEEDVSLHEVFYGAVRVYLSTRSSLFQHTPGPIDRLLDHPALLRWVSRFGSTTDAADLGPLALSVLKGEQGEHRRELERLARWLIDSFRPEIIHLTNSMFLGMAATLKREVGVPVVCSVQGEELFIEGLAEPYRASALDLMRGRAGDVDQFIATTREYAVRMGALLAIPGSRMQIVPLGVKLEGHASARPAPRQDSRFVVGYLGRVCPEKGFDLLAEAFRQLASQVGADRVMFRSAGYLAPKYRAFYESVKEKIGSWGLAESFEYLGEVDRRAKLEFLRGLDVLSVPTLYRESKGLGVLEGLASGVPFVQPRIGSFPEMLERSGGGVLFEPGSVEALTRELRELMEDPARRHSLGESGRRAMLERGSDAVMAAETLKVYLAALTPWESSQRVG